MIDIKGQDGTNEHLDIETLLLKYHFRYSNKSGWLQDSKIKSYEGFFCIAFENVDCKIMTIVNTYFPATKNTKSF